MIILGIFYVFVTYAFVTGYGLDGTAGVAAQFNGETAPPGTRSPTATSAGG